MRSEIIDGASEFAKPFESTKLKPYWDPAGYPTQGTGRLLSRITLEDKIKELGSRKAANEWLYETYPEITLATAEQWLEEDMNTAYGGARRLINANLTVNQWITLVDFVFNLGAGQLYISTLRRMINRGEIIEAAPQHLRWNKARGIVHPGLTRRCRSRYNLYLS